ncbi:MAG: glutaredoxin [Candidatus Riflebacteria bacterium]|nr:glutaredoxin [Candidatus Riflebacteria bacterium]
MPKKVNLYRVEWCPHCVRAKSFLDQMGIKYTDHDVESDDDAWHRAMSLTKGIDIVPVVEIDGNVVFGTFDSSFESKLRTHLQIMKK